MRDWLVTADDRTGAFESAAEIAGVVGAVQVTAHEPPAADGVVDIGSRHLAAHEAVRRASEMPVARWNAHKIDSTLRGNWAAEIRARARVTGLRVLVVAAWPAMGRTCIGGVVHVRGASVGDVAEHLPEAQLLADLPALHHWLAGDAEIGSVDVTDTATLMAVAAAAASHDLLVAAPAGPIGALFAERARRTPTTLTASGTATGTTTLPPNPCALPALVVCGSATDISRLQVERLAAAVPGVEVLTAPPATGDLVPHVVVELAGRASARLASRPYATVVLVGGDTAATVLGDMPRIVGGTVRPGMPWSHDAQGEGPLVITKAGGFGSPDALVGLFEDETG